jgi:hypothetical protein
LLKPNGRTGFSLSRGRDRLKPVLPLLLLIFLASCAGQQPPTGGPSDTTHPKVDTSIPNDRQTNVPRDTKLYFQFDRDVDKSSFQQAFSISPYVNGALQFKWSGHDEVQVVLPEGLRDSTTYTVQLSRDLKSRRGNTLATPIHLTFSTGPFVDTGSLSGFLLVPIVGSPIRASDLFVFAYDITLHRPDTLNFTHSPPDLLTQPNDQGIWQFLSMKVGHRYRVFAATDVFRNKVFDPGTDAFGIPAGDVMLDSATKSGIFIRMAAPIDTIRPELQDVEVIDSFHVRPHFSEAIDTADIRATNFILAGNTVLAAYLHAPEKKPGQITLLLSSPLVPNQKYTLEARIVHDVAHNPINDTANKISFEAPSTLRGMTTPTLAAHSIADSMRDIPTYPTLTLTFSDAVVRDSLEHGLTLTDTAGRAVRTTFKWMDDARVAINPVDTLLPNIFYTFTFRTASIRSPLSFFPPAKDTTLRFHFRTANARDFGKVTGDITIADSFFAQNPQSALVVQLLLNGAPIEQRVLPPGQKRFEFERVVVGSYRVRAYLSKNGTADYDAGSIQPWRFGVPTGEYAKPFDTRPRWTIANIDFEVK